MKTVHSFNLGDKVNVFQMSVSKGLLFEGTARIVQIEDADEYYIVRFDRDLDDFVHVEDCPTYARFVDREGQENPEDYVRYVNRKIGKA